MQTAAIRQPLGGLVRARARPSALRVSASTLWGLQPDPKWCAKPENAQFCKRLGQVDLTEAFGTKRVCSIASHDYEASSGEPQDLCIVDHGGIHLIFEAEGTSNAMDSPSRLFVTDVDSICDILLDGHKLEKKQKTKVKPGACMCMGQEARYVVTRNVFAHA